MQPSRLAACAVALLFPASYAAAQQAESGGEDRIVVEGERGPPLELDTEVADDGSTDQGISGGEGTEAVISYSPDYFRPYSPTNAQDMVNRVPGFSARGGGNARGFGQNAGNVLINGERPSSKSQDSGDILQRIPVSEVVRIDLIRGQTAGIDMGGQPVVVNVIRRVSSNRGGTWRAQLNYNSFVDSVRPGGEVSYNTEFLGANVTLGLQSSAFTNGERRIESIIVPGIGLEQLIRLQNQGGRPLGYAATINAERDIGEWTLRLNGRYDEGGFGNHEWAEVIAGDARPSGAVPGTPEGRLANDYESFVFENDQTEWEIGGDLDRRLSETLSLKIIALQSMESQEGFNRFERYDANGLVSAQGTDSSEESGETIGRAFLTWNPNDRHSIEFGGEVAYNYLDTSTQFISGSGVGGGIDTTKVSELRGEPFVNWLWRISDDFGLNTALQAEVSEIEQSGDANKSRSFFYPKGSVTATWDIADNTQLRTTLDRSVGQLSFGDFARSVNFQNDTQDAGNPDLVPEQTWRLESVLEQRFWDDGVVSLEVRREWIEDAQGLVPLVGGGVGTGSLGDATNWRIRAEIDVPLDRILWQDARIQANADYGSSEVTDPFTGEERLMSSGGGNFFGGFNNGGRRGFFVSFRKDYPEEQFSWGVSYRNNGPVNYSFRQDELTLTRQHNGGFEGFIETTRFFGVNMRLQINNIGNFYSDQTRYIFAGQRGSSAIEAIERRRSYFDWGAQFRVRGTF